jgi:hypothetical protein
MGIINLDNIKEYRIYELILYDDIFFLIKLDNNIYRINFNDYDIIDNNKYCKLTKIKSLNYDSDNIHILKYKDILNGSKIEIKNCLINIDQIILSDDYKCLFYN